MDEWELIAKCQENEPEAFEQLVKPYLAMAYRTAYLIIHDKHLAQDAVQEGLIEAYQHIDRLDKKRGMAFRNWLYRIITFRALNLVRKQKPVVEYEEMIPEEATTPLDNVIQREEQRQIWQAIRSMKAEHRAVIILYYYEGFSVSEIAKITGSFEGTVKSRMHKARKLIAQQLDKNFKGSDFLREGAMTHD
ncbi:RNA polymerase sigma factor [Brevibacillus brevis]|uniref:RNA polymerase sigma factor n=1 Tax=Brevibacillus brevis TaxID=1393 RepID=UPI0007D8C3EE|nr:RNA polymerase sigma factor [Brevibacillus brevis]